jgi:hypothetical protein
MKKNLRAISIFVGCISASCALMVLSALTPKQNLYLISGKITLIDNENIALTTKGKDKKLQSNYTFLALLLLSGSIPFSIMSLLVVSNRLPEIEIEADEYNKQRMIRKIRQKSELETEQELCNANKTVTVTAHEKNLESAFIELAEASDWHYVNPENEEEEIRDATTQYPLPSIGDLELKKNS